MENANVQLNLCSKCHINLASKFNDLFFEIFDISPLHIMLHDRIVNLESLKEVYKLVQENQFTYKNNTFCNDCLRNYKYNEYSAFLSKIGYFKCIYCKETKSQKNFMPFTQNLREFFNFYEEELETRLLEINNTCKKCKHYSSIIALSAESVSIELQMQYFAQFRDIDSLNISRQRIEYIHNRINTLANNPIDKHDLEYCIEENIEIQQELEFIKLARQRFNHVSVNYSNSQHCRAVLRTLFNPIIGHACPCRVCFGKMITIKKCIRKLNTICILPFDRILITNRVHDEIYIPLKLRDDHIYISNKQKIQHSNIIKRILNEDDHTQNVTSFPSLKRLCINIFTPETIQNVLQKYDFDEKTRIQFYKNF